MHQSLHRTLTVDPTEMKDICLEIIINFVHSDISDAYTSAKGAAFRKGQISMQEELWHTSG